MRNTYASGREKHPSAKLPENKETVIWHYMDDWKFMSLLQRKALYLCRADKLQDRFEGTYSKRQIDDMNQRHSSIGYGHLAPIELERRKRWRQTTYISCWCVSDYDLDLMWKGYTNSDKAIAIKSTVSRLEKVCDDADVFRPLDLSIVNYFDSLVGQHINYTDGFAPFINKDQHFRLDNEFRVVLWQAYSVPAPEECFLPVSFDNLIERVVLPPRASKRRALEVRNLLDEYNLKHVPIESSRDDRDVAE